MKTSIRVMIGTTLVWAAAVMVAFDLWWFGYMRGQDMPGVHLATICGLILAAVGVFESRRGVR